MREKATKSPKYIHGDLSKKETWEKIKLQGPFDIAIDFACSGNKSHDGIRKYAYTVMKPGGKLLWIESELWNNNAVKNYKSKHYKTMEYVEGVDFDWIVYTF